MAAGPDVGTGTTIVFSGITFEVNEITWNGQEIADIDFTHLASTTHEAGPGDLPDYGMIEVNVNWDEEHALPTLGNQQTLTIDPTGTGSPHTFTGAAFLKAIDGIVMGVETKMVADLTFRWEGAVTKA